MRIKIINPNTTLEMTQTIDLAGQAIARDGTEIVTVSPEFGPASIESHYDEYLCAPGLIDEIRKGENENFDAYIIACFGDPALDACREITVKPVIGIAEAAMITASIISAQFSIVSLIPRTKAVTRELVMHYGFGHKLAAFGALHCMSSTLSKTQKDAFKPCERPLSWRGMKTKPRRYC